ncbi:MAG: sortase [Chloroflexi bacterium]|nr:sortase [Chloroflexota bacterium]
MDSDDNGTRQVGGPFNGAVISSAVTLGPAANEPTTDTDADPTNPPGEAPDAQSNRTVDFGFYRVEIGNLVFIDINGDGDYDAGTDLPMQGAVVRLFTSTGIEILVGPDGILGTADDAATGVTTGASGTYLFSGLPQGDYIVRVTPPAGNYTSTVDTSNPADTTDPDGSVDNNDNGIGTAAGQVSSGTLTMNAGETGASINVSDASGTTTDTGVDFGFVTPLFSLGNRVWFDTDNSGAINGAEVGVDGVTVQLYAADAGGNPTGAVLATQTTANGGYYRFDDLLAGDYVVVIPSSQFASGGPLEGYWSSGTTIDATGTVNESAAPDPDNNTDSDDNGTLQSGGTFDGAVISGAVTLGPNADEPTTDADADPTNPPGEAPDAQSNRTVDFGFYRASLGNLVYLDTNGDGTFNAGDVPLQGATVQLFASDGTTEINVGPDGIFGTADDAPGGVTTSASGTYLFSGLPRGDYIVRVTPPAGYASTVDTADSADTGNPNTNTDNNDNGIGQNGGQVSSNIVTLTPGSAGAASNNTVNNATGTTNDPTLDFGFVTSSGLSKSITDTSEIFTSGNDVAIGEIITYEVGINLPVGVALTNVTVTDRMDLRLAYVDCLSVIVAGTDVTATVCPSAVVSPITDPGDSPTNPANPGRQVEFTLGDIPAQASASTVEIQYRAIVLDVIENQDGVDLNNNVTWAFDGGSFSTSAPNVNIVEPDLTIEKTATPTSNVAIGTPVQFTLTIGHTNQSTADAFDVVVSDFLPATLEYIPCSLTVTGLPPTTSTATCPAPATDLIFTWDDYPLGSTTTITFNARLLGSPATNLASVAWTSLPIDPVNGLPVQLSPHNSTSTERWYDPLDDVNVYSVSDSVTINEPGGGGTDDDEEEAENLPKELPDSGFAPNVATRLPIQPVEKAYASTDVWLEIPSLAVRIPVVGVPVTDDNWDVTWLWRQAGWLDGTAFPGWKGNSVLTGHVVLPNGNAGPFAALGDLKWGDRIIIRAYGTVYIYEVRQNRIVSPYNISVLQHEEDAWLTLLTCKDYNESADTYARRIAVRAVLVKVQTDTSSGESSNIR